MLPAVTNYTVGLSYISHGLSEVYPPVSFWGLYHALCRQFQHLPEVCEFHSWKYLPFNLSVAMLSTTTLILSGGSGPI